MSGLSCLCSLATQIGSCTGGREACSARYHTRSAQAKRRPSQMWFDQTRQQMPVALEWHFVHYRPVNTCAWREAFPKKSLEGDLTQGNLHALSSMGKSRLVQRWLPPRGWYEVPVTMMKNSTTNQLSGQSKRSRCGACASTVSGIGR